MLLDSFDLTVVGLGAMGSAAAYQLVKAGQSVLALDRFAPPHLLAPRTVKLGLSSRPISSTLSTSH